MVSMSAIHGERQGRADLHIHTTWSDGVQRPEAVVAAASGRVDLIAITDHDEIRGALVAREYARRQPLLGVDVIVGEEISTLNGHLSSASSSRSVCRRGWPRFVPSS
jgi:predicted metal-dependent phosphoesterase TrpH